MGRTEGSLSPSAEQDCARVSATTGAHAGFHLHEIVVAAALFASWYRPGAALMLPLVVPPGHAGGATGPGARTHRVA